MKSDKPLYLVASRPGAATRAERGRGSHLRLVRSVSPERMLPGQILPGQMSAGRTEPAVATTSLRVVAQLAPELLPAGLMQPPPRRSLSRPRWQRLLQAASDVALLFVAVLIGLRPNA
jgi:hypothetical protein